MTRKQWWSVWAFYAYKRVGWGTRDAEIRKVARRVEDGTGTATSGRVPKRDLSFDVATKAEADALARRLRKVPGVTVKVYDYSA